jgi:hypothetical protein
MDTNAITAVQAAREVAEARLATIRADSERKALERVSGLVEADSRVVPWYDYPGYEEASDYPEAGYSVSPYWQTSVHDREGERYLPYYENEMDLRRLRADARSFSAFFDLARGAIDTLANYTIGAGPTLQAEPANPEETENELVKQVQVVLDQFAEDNSLIGVLDREIHQRAREEGEAPIALYPEGWRTKVAIIEPDYIAEPGNPRAIEEWKGLGDGVNFWWHGVHTRYDADMQRENSAHPIRCRYAAGELSTSARLSRTLYGRRDGL